MQYTKIDNKVGDGSNIVGMQQRERLLHGNNRRVPHESGSQR